MKPRILTIPQIKQLCADGVITRAEMKKMYIGKYRICSAALYQFTPEVPTGKGEEVMDRYRFKRQLKEGAFQNG